MSAAIPAASRLLCRSLAANSAKTSSRAVAASRTTAATPTAPGQQQQRHALHTSAPLESRKNRSPYASVSAKDMGLLDGANDNKKKSAGAASAAAAAAKDKKNTSHEARESRASSLVDYDAEDLEILKAKYTPEQLEALLLGEQLVSPEDLVAQGRVRNDPYRMRHLEDFSRVVPIIDKRIKKGTPVDTSARFMTPDEFGDDLVDFVQEQEAKENGGKRDLIDVPEAYAMFQEMRSKLLGKGGEAGESLSMAELSEALDRVLPAEDMEAVKAGLEMARASRAAQAEGEGEGEAATEADLNPEVTQEALEASPDWVAHHLLHQRNSMTGFEGGDTALAPELMDKVPGVAGLFKSKMDEEEATLDPEGKYQDIKRKTGMSVKEILQIYNKQTKILVSRYVSNQTRLGKIRSQYVLAIAGNENGKLGVGEAKSVDPESAQNKAKLKAIQNMQPIRRYENRTIYGNVEGKVGATVVRLQARPPGFGLRVSHRFFEIARAAGIQDLAGKMPRSRNPMNSVKACVQALHNQPDPEQIAIGRGRKLVDARKVYYGGAVY